MTLATRSSMRILATVLAAGAMGCDRAPAPDITAPADSRPPATRPSASAPATQPGKAKENATAYQYKVKTVAAQPIVSVRGKTTAAKRPATIGEFMQAAMGHVTKNGGQMAGPPFTRVHSIEGDTIDLEAGIPVAKPLQGE